MFNRIKIGEGSEIEAFLQGRKRGLLISDELFNSNQELWNFYYHKGRYSSGRSYVGVFHRIQDKEFFINNAKSHYDTGRILGYPPKAYENFENTFDKPFSEKIALNYFGIKFVCLKEDYWECVKWLNTYAKPGTYLRRGKYA